MFIELTDHLRCPAAHDESFLVLVPDAVESRGVRRGVLGCPVCDREYPVRDGVAHFGTPAQPAMPCEGLEAGAVAPLLGIEGPGGYVALIGGPAALATEADLLPGIGLVLVNPPAGTMDAPPRISVLEADRLPVRSRALRGVVLGAEYAGDAAWRAEARRVLLPGRRLVGAGPVHEDVELLASAGGWWVGV